MMRASELLAWLNATKSFAATIMRADDFADLVRDGHVRVHADRDLVIGLMPASSAPMPAILPATIS
jgi:hypothetical protein